jgi:hypothetical protein
VTAEHDNSMTLRASACSVEFNKQELGNRGRIMAGGRPPLFNSFTCPNCQALYQIVKVEAGPETDNREIICRVCGGPLTGREGKLVLKYFVLRKATRSRRRA